MKGKHIVGILGLLLLVTFGVTRFIARVSFNQECGGYLKRAADANTLELAKENLGLAVAYIEREGLTSGYTSILWKTPDEELGFWYENLSESLAELQRLDPEASSLEKSNMLIKLRETLLDDGKKGQNVTVPKGVAIYPSNTIFMIWWLAGLIFFFIGFGKEMAKSL